MVRTQDPRSLLPLVRPVQGREAPELQIAPVTYCLVVVQVFYEIQPYSRYPFYFVPLLYVLGTTPVPEEVRLAGPSGKTPRPCKRL